jgi:O-glycosyl hydrolase
MRLLDLFARTQGPAHRKRPAPPGLEELGPRLVLDATLAVDPSLQYQTLEGWGTSLAWWANVVGGFPDAARNDYVQKVFDPVNGLGLNAVRYNIGGGENPAYHFLQFRKAVPGFEPSPGVWDWTADANQRWVLQVALAYGVNQLEANSNSPPYWMTNSGSVTGAPGSADNLNPDYYNAFANYLAEVVQHYRDTWGITFKTLDPFNEPNATWWAFGGGQEGCHFDRASQDAVIPLVGAALADRGLDTAVSAADESGIDDAVRSFASYGRTSQGYVAQINTHSYWGSARLQLANLANSFGKGLSLSEYGDGDASGLTMSRDIVNDMKNLRPTIWTYWQAVDSNDGGGGWGFLNSPMRDETSTQYVINQKYYVMGNYSKFIHPGYRFIAIDDQNSLAAYDASSGTLVIVTTNSGSADTNLTYDLSGFSSLGASVTAYRTSAGEHLAQLPGIAVSGGSFRATARAGSVTTYVLTGVSFTGARGIDPYAYYELTNANSGLALGIAGASTTAGAELVQAYNDGTTQEQWGLFGTGGGYYKLVNRNSGLVAVVNGAVTTPGASIIQWVENTNPNQQWRLADAGDGSYRLINRNSGLVLDVSGGSTSAGAGIVQARGDDSPHQQWGLVQVTFPQGPLPDGWSDGDIGSPGLAGSAAFNATDGSWTVSGSGSGTGNCSDQFNFASQSLDGDVSLRALVAGLTYTSPLATAGVMFRGSADAGAAFAAVAVRPDNGVYFQWRATAGGPPDQVSIAGLGAPVWVQLVRSGNVFTGYYSTDGDTWIQIGTPQTIEMSSTALAGLAVTALNNSALNTATFTDVTIIRPPTVRIAVDQPLLAPADGGLVNVGLHVQLDPDADPRTRVSVQIFGNDQAGASDVDDIGAEALRLRARTSGNGTGRVYLIVVTATDSLGRTSVALATVGVPPGDSPDDVSLVEAEAASAQAWYDAFQAAPPGFSLLGEGPAF